MSTGNQTGGIADENGEMVQRFGLRMHNLGLERAGDELLTMLRSGRWRKWSQGGMMFEFLPGEFDYFLSQQEIYREYVMIIPDVTAKATLEEAMDERRTGESGYRRPIKTAREQVPELPGRPITPYGYGKAEGRSLAESGESSSSARPPLGSSVRRYRDTGGESTRPPRDERARWERLAASAVRLPDQELDFLIDCVVQEKTKRESADKATQD